MRKLGFPVEMRRKRLASTTTTAAIIFISLLMVFLVHQLSLSCSSSSTSGSVIPPQGKQMEQQKPKHQKLLPPTQISQGVSHSTSQPITCDLSHDRYDLCFLNGSTVINPTLSTLSLVDPMQSDSPPPQQNIKIRPYPRKWENNTMSQIKQFTLNLAPSAHCDVHHNSPALVFSTSGYTGNLFHDFNDGLIPLFVTIRSSFPNQKPVLVIANCQNWWLMKYSLLIREFTPHPVVNLENETLNHCFPSASIGLISHGYMTIDSKLLPYSDTFHNFRAFLGHAYLRANYHFSIKQTSARPRLVLASRIGNVGRVIRNQDQVIQAAERIGFEVKLFTPNKYTSLSDAYDLINSSHAMLGVHGAALTHFLFLRPGSVFIQVVPIGIGWLAKTCFGNPANELGLHYMEYKIRVQESSLVDKYGMDHPVLRDPDPISNRAFADFKNIYLENQDVTLDLERIGRYLDQAYDKSMKFLEEAG